MAAESGRTLPWWAKTPGLHWSRLDPIGNRRVAKTEMALSVEPRFIDPEPETIDLDETAVNLDEREQEPTK